MDTLKAISPSDLDSDLDSDSDSLLCNSVTAALLLGFGPSEMRFCTSAKWVFVRLQWNRLTTENNTYASAGLAARHSTSPLCRASLFYMGKKKAKICLVQLFLHYWNILLSCCCFTPTRPCCGSRILCHPRALDEVTVWTFHAHTVSLKWPI